MKLLNSVNHQNKMLNNEIKLNCICAECNRCRLYRKVLTYKPFPNNADLKMKKNLLNKKKEIVTQTYNNNEAMYKEFRYRVNVQGYKVVKVIELICTCRQG